METGMDDKSADFDRLKFIDKAKADNKPFFLWLNPTRMHVTTICHRKRGACEIPERAGPFMKPVWPQLEGGRCRYRA